jgi:large conductance mechanosensitive channel
MRGNVLDLAVGVIIGAAFGKIVDSIVSDLIMPVIGAVFGGLDFSNYYLPLSHLDGHPAYADAKKLGAVFGFGSFLTAALNFLIVAFALFLLIRAVNKVVAGKHAAQAEAPPPPPRQEVLLEEIRDLLAKRSDSAPATRSP